jgi:hypothetical protein
VAVNQTWTTLREEIARYLKRDLTTLDEDVNYWIAQAELRISREVRPRGYQRYATSNFTQSDRLLEIPARLIGVISMFVIDSDNVRTPVFRREYSWLNDYWPDTSLEGLPKYYANIDGVRFAVAPTPDDDYQFELSYYERLQQLDSGNETNWLTENAYDLLLFGSLLETPPFLRDDERTQMWQTYYDRAAASLTAVEQAFQTDDASMVKGS